MTKLYLNISFNHPKEEVYCLAHTLGKRLSEYLGEELFALLLDSKILLNSFSIKKLQCTKDKTYELHPAAKALEGFLLKVIKGKKLKESESDNIGGVFGKKDAILRQKIKDKKIIAKTKSVWDYCRNDIMHYSPNHEYSSSEERKKYDEIVEVMLLLYKDLYGRTEPDDKIDKGFNKYFLAKVRQRNKNKK